MPHAAPPVGGGYYCALMGHPFEGLYKKDTYMFVSEEPLRTAVLHNRRAIHNKETRTVAPHWYLLLIVGPFPTVSAALTFGQHWVHNTRGAQSKLRRGIVLAKLWAIAYYVHKPKRTRLYMMKRAPAAYARAYVRLTRPAG